jgi:rhodanese-related sulfurtransferase
MVDSVADSSVIDERLAEARARIQPRVSASDLYDAIAGGAIVVDTRSSAQRDRDGELPGAVVMERNVLEWRLDPTSPHRIAQMDKPDRRVIVVCDEGYASSLAAASLLDLGLTDVTDLAGGYQAWRRHLSTDAP